jgi:hypothetical protein
MKKSRKTKALVIAALVLVMLLLFANRNLTRQSPQTTGETISPSTVTLTPTRASLHDLRITATYIASLPKFPTIPPPPAMTITPTAVVLPTATSTLAPPSCTFPLAGTTAEESKPEEYTFSEPQVVLTSEFQPSIVGWLPDNQNALIMLDKFTDFTINGAKQNIELFNPETQETRLYAIRGDFSGPMPAWNSALNAVVYPNWNHVIGGTDSIQLRISYGNPDETQLLADNLPQLPMAVKPDGSQTAYFIDNQLIRLDGELNPLAPVPADRKRWDYLHEFLRNDNNNFVEEFKMAWRPNSAQIFLYNHAGDGLVYTYILDTDSGRLCSLNFDGWASEVRWSPNGRYLAIVRAQERVPIQASDVAVLDTATGKYYVFKTADLKIKEGRAQDIAWAPDNRHLLFTVRTAYSKTTHIYSGLLYLGDFISGQVEQVLPSFQFNIVGDARPNLAWSPDGSKLLMNGPSTETTTETSTQTWLMYVQNSGK